MNARNIEDLLLADAALRDGLLDAAKVAGALRSFWDRRREKGATIRRELEALLGPQDLERLSGEVASRVAGGMGAV